MSSNELSPSKAAVAIPSRHQPLQAGQYWRSLSASKDGLIKQDMVLLIKSIRWVDDRPHTVILRPHPSILGATHLDSSGISRRTHHVTEHRFLLDEFLALFEFAPDAASIREAEIAVIQNSIAAIQSELLAGQSDPAILNEVVAIESQKIQTAQSGRASESTQTDSTSTPVSDLNPQAASELALGGVESALRFGITESRIAAMREAANREHSIATIKANWIKGKTAAIAKAIQSMTPFYEEQAAAALAHTEDVRTHVDKIMAGIGTLDLYIGKNVTVDTICTGASAASSEPLTIVQRKLVMDEELAVFADVNDRFDYRSEEVFFETLAGEPGLVDQVFPTPRCVLAMCTTRRFIDYGDQYSNLFMNEENRKVFLLIRDGENIHRVFSPVESHLGSSRLFPTSSEQEDKFRGVDGSTIRFEDVAYTDRLARHEAMALHYKRFLVLLCGLDHRLKLLGDFYEESESLSFVSRRFQDQYFRFLHDDDHSQMIEGHRRPSVLDWVSSCNKFLAEGTVVLCRWSSLIDCKTAPGAFTRHYMYPAEQRYFPVEDIGLAVVKWRGAGLFVDVRVAGRTATCEERSFNCSVEITQKANGDDVAWLCMAVVEPDDLEWYIRHRSSREDHLFYIFFFKKALEFLRAERLQQEPTRLMLLDAMSKGSVSTPNERPDVVNQTVRMWRSANKWKALPNEGDSGFKSAFEELLNLAHSLSGGATESIPAVNDFIQTQSFTPLRLCSAGSGSLILYAAPQPHERDDRLCPHVWVHRIELKRHKSSVREKSRKWSLLRSSVTSETVTHEWPECQDWLDLESPFKSLDEKIKAFSLCSDSLPFLEGFQNPYRDEQWFNEVLAQYRDAQQRSSASSKQYVLNAGIVLPFGLILNPRLGLHYLCLIAGTAAPLVADLAPNDLVRDKIQAEFVNNYRNRKVGLDKFEAARTAGLNGWVIGEVRFNRLKTGKLPLLAASDMPDASGYFKGEDPTVESALRGLVKDRSKSSLWFAPWVFNDNAEPRLDSYLGIRLPENYSPGTLYRLTSTPKGGSEADTLHWIDFVPRDCVDEICKELEVNPRKLCDALIKNAQPDRSSSSTSQIDLHISPGFTGEDMSKYFGSNFYHPEDTDCGFRAVSSTDLPDYPQPPPKVLRWYRMAHNVESSKS